MAKLSFFLTDQMIKLISPGAPPAPVRLPGRKFFLNGSCAQKLESAYLHSRCTPAPPATKNANEKEHKTMSFASVIANRAVLSVAATRAHAKSSNRRSLIVKAEGEEIAETETPAQAPAVSREEDAKIFVDESFGLIFFTSGRAKRMSRRLNPRSKLRQRRRKGAFARRFRLSKIRIGGALF